MTAGISYVVLLLVDGACLAVLLRRGRGGILAAVVAAGLVYDSAVLAAGAWLPAGDPLRHANAGRFVVHALAIPLLLPIAVQLAGPVRRRATMVAALASAAGLAGVGLVVDVAGLHLVPHAAGGVLRYVPADPPAPPLAAIVATLAVVVAGLLRWRRGGGPLLAVAALACVIGSAAMGVTDPPVLGSLAETILLLGIVAVWSQPLTRRRSAERALS